MTTPAKPVTFAELKERMRCDYMLGSEQQNQLLHLLFQYANVEDKTAVLSFVNALLRQVSVYDADELSALEQHYIHKDKVRAAVDAIKAVAPIVGHYLKREINAPANHQEFQQEAAMKLHKFNSALDALTALLENNP